MRSQAGGLRIFFPGIRTTNQNEVYDGMTTATAPLAATPWKLAPGPVAVKDFAYDRTPSATTSRTGTPFQAWYYTGAQIAVHKGLDPGTPDQFFDSGTLCCAVAPSLVTDRASGDIWLAWCTGNDKPNGIWVQQVNQGSGAPVGQKQFVKGSTVPASGALKRTCDFGRTAVAATPGGGVYVAAENGLPTTTRVLLWRLGKPNPVALANSNTNHAHVKLSADASGRLWAAWIENRAGGDVVVVRHSDTQVAGWSAPTVLASPPGYAAGLFDLDLSATAHGADVLVRGLAPSGKAAVLLTRVAG